MKYVVEIEFEGKRHCLQCPLRGGVDGNCKLQSEPSESDNWDEQLSKCPLKELNLENKVSPHDGGCWYCYTKTDNMLFDTEFDTYVHEDCLRKELKENPDNPEAHIMVYLLD